MNHDMLKIILLLVLPSIFQLFTAGTSIGMGTAQEPTAIVLDDETGKPIEGAVAIAIWRKHSIKEAAWFEGGKMVPVRIEEVISDKEGKIYIDDFWDWHLNASSYPRLTIYKPGYVCWDQKLIYISEFKSERRQDFDKKTRIVRMKQWPEEFSFNGHWRFMSHCTGYGDIHEAPNKLFLKSFNYERQYQIKEDNIIYKQKKDMMERKRRKK